MKRIGLKLILLVVIGGSLVVLLFNNKHLEVKIKNESNRDISGLALILNESEEIKQLEPIVSAEEKEIKVDLPDNFNEGTLRLSYTDKNGSQQSETVFGYIEKGYSGKALVIIKSINEDGSLDIEIDSKSSIL